MKNKNIIITAICVMSPMLLLAQSFEEYVINKVNEYRKSNELAELKKSEDYIHYDNIDYCFDASETTDTNELNKLYDNYFNNNEINNSEYCIAYNDGGTTFSDRRTIRVNMRKYPNFTPTDYEFDDVINGKLVLTELMKDTNFVSVLNLGSDTTLNRYISVGNAYCIQDVKRLKVNRFWTLYGFECIYVINIILYVKRLN
jgi:hypothetical protein